MKSKYLLILTLGVIPQILSACSKNDDEISGGNSKTSEAKCYYVDSRMGNDYYTGLSHLSPFKTLAKVEELSLNPGDTVLFARGSVFKETLKISVSGEEGKVVLFDAYGNGPKPKIEAPDNSLYGIHIYNSSYLTVRNLDIKNYGKVAKQNRCGLKIEAFDYGVSRNITIQSLDIHDVNGLLKKSQGPGSGIAIYNNKWEEKPSVFDNLLIEHCYIARCDRNGIMWYGASKRTSDWYLSTNNVVRYNLIEEVPGDGIVPIGCTGTVIEYNRMKKSPGTLPAGDSAAGMWPWSCDDTVIRFNEVSDMMTCWDGQGFDSDDNCNNTVIEYNYSHDNGGGFLLVCSSGEWLTNPNNMGCVGTKIRYNISINDGYRDLKVKDGKAFSPTIHVAGPARDTYINNNVFYIAEKPSGDLDRCVIHLNSWKNEAPDGNYFNDNFIYAKEKTAFRFEDVDEESSTFKNNYVVGEIDGAPEKSLIKVDASTLDEAFRNGNYESLMDSRDVADGRAKVRFPSPEKIAAFFSKIQSAD